MTRETKFRVWDIKNKRFMEESHCAILGNGKLIITLSGWYNTFTNINRDEYIIQEYIGIKDKNNAEIYEGDIVKQCLYLYDEWAGNDLYGCIMHRIVEMASYTENQTNRNVGFASFPDINYKDWSGHPIANKCEIVGNIFETPELLNKTNEPKHGKSKASYRDS